MTVFVLNDYASVRGGADQVALASAIALADGGHDVIFVAPVGPIDPQLQRHSKIKVHCLDGHDILSKSKSFSAAWQGMWNPAVSASISAMLSDTSVKDSVVHIHGWTKALTTSAFKTATRLGFQPVVTLHDYFVVCPNGAFFDYPAGETCQRAPLSLSCICRQCDRRSYTHKLWRTARQVVQLQSGRFPAELRHAIVISKHSEEVLRPYLPQETRRYFVRNPIEAEHGPRVAAEKNGAYTFIGRLTVEKAALDFAKAAALMGIAPQFVGDGYLREDILRACPAAEITGWQDRAGVGKRLANSRVLVFPSIWHETFGLSVGEALALGIPVVVSDRCAAAEQVVDGFNGLLFHGGDVQDLKSKLEKLRDDAFVERLSHGAYERYWQNPPTLRNHAIQLEEVYEEILKSQRSAGQTNRSHQPV